MKDSFERAIQRNSQQRQGPAFQLLAVSSWGVGPVDNELAAARDLSAPQVVAPFPPTMDEKMPCSEHTLNCAF